MEAVSAARVLEPRRPGRALPCLDSLSQKDANPLTTDVSIRREGTMARVSGPYVWGYLDSERHGTAWLDAARKLTTCGDNTASLDL